MKSKTEEKGLFVTQEAMKVGSDGCFKNAFDPQDVLFYILDRNFSDNKVNYVQEVNGELRIEELKNALQTELNLLFMKLGLGNNYFRFENNSLASKTATEVISENLDLYRTIAKHEKILENAIKELIQSIAFIGQSFGLFQIKTDNIQIDFDDSIIESKEQNRLQDRQDVAMDAQSLVEYRMNWYGEDEENS
ncbi:MAG: phage portal protein [Oscillospiraceae bacterium]|jgi:A118 family predicted phage portal protein|nr:phage portal protein [Oscillospiraceae bacterium]